MFKKINGLLLMKLCIHQVVGYQERMKLIQAFLALPLLAVRLI